MKETASSRTAAHVGARSRHGVPIHLAARSGAVPHTATPRTITPGDKLVPSTRCTIFAHCLSDYIEGITHSICTLEFEDATARSTTGFFENLDLPRPLPHQYEFAKLIPTHHRFETQG